MSTNPGSRASRSRGRPRLMGQGVPVKGLPHENRKTPQASLARPPTGGHEGASARTAKEVLIRSLYWNCELRNHLTPWEFRPTIRAIMVVSAGNAARTIPKELGE
jgi:hypothetical protein